MSRAREQLAAKPVPLPFLSHEESELISEQNPLPTISKTLMIQPETPLEAEKKGISMLLVGGIVLVGVVAYMAFK